MRRALMVAAGLVLLAVSVSAPARAVPIAAPALKAASNNLAVTAKVGCWAGDCDVGYGYRRPYYGYGYGGGYGYGYRQYYGYGFRPYYRSYYGGCGGYGYGGCGYRPYYRTYYGGCGGGCGYGYYAHPRAYFFNHYW